MFFISFETAKVTGVCFSRMIGADCQLRWQNEADYLRAIQGFVQAGPQLVLQVIIVLRGALIHSFRETMRTLLEEGLSVEFFQGE